MLKAPRPGLVKTRLGQTVGPARAAAIFRWLGRRQLEALPAGWAVEVHHEPADAAAEMRAWLGGRPALYPQAAGDLGARLVSAMAASWSRRARPMVFLGGDCPELGPELLEETAAALAEGQAVVGPADDGGYYLLGLPRPVPGVFAGVNWSTATVAEETLARLAAAGLRWRELPALADIDTAADWAAFCVRRGGDPVPAEA